MAGRSKRHFHDDPTASDPEDEDYSAVSPRQKRRATQPRKSASARPKKRQRHGYEDTEDDIDDGDSDVEMTDADSEEVEEEEPEVNPATGRLVRSATKKVNYEDPSEDDIEDTGAEEEAPKKLKSSSSRAKTATKSPKAERKSLIVKLRISPEGRITRTRRNSKSSKRAPTPDHPATRRSSRLSHDDQSAMYSLTSSGKHVQVQRPHTRSPEFHPAPRPTRASKGLKKPPSAIMEASQEASFHTKAEGDEEGEPVDIANIEEAEAAGEEHEAQVPSSDAGSVVHYDIAEDAGAEGAEAEGAGLEEGVIQESVHEDEGNEDNGEGNEEQGDENENEDEDEDDGPINRRNLRVSSRTK